MLPAQDRGSQESIQVRGNLSNVSSVWSLSPADFPLDQHRSAASTPGVSSQHLPPFTTRATGPLTSLRARQIQADEGIVSNLYRPPIRQTSGSADQSLSSTGPIPLTDYGDDELSTGGSRLFRGRARAGTLPSSWNSETSSTYAADGQQRHMSGSENDSNGMIGRPWSNTISQVGSTLPSIHLNSIGQESSLRATSASSSPLTNSSLHMPQGLTPPAAFPTSRLVSTRQMRSNSALEFDRTSILPELISQSPTLITNSPSAPFDTAVRDANRNRSNTTSGFGNSPFGPSYFTSTWTDNRVPSAGATRPSSSLSNTLTPSTSAAAEYQKRNQSFESRQDMNLLNDFSGRQTLDYLGLDNEDSVIHRAETSQMTPQRNRASTLASVVPRGNDQSSGLPYESFQYNGPNEVDGDESYVEMSDSPAYASYAFGQIIDPSQLAAMASAAGINSAGGIASLQGRNRAGTIAALGGPGGRQRIEQELLRMAALGQGPNLNGLGINSLLNSLRATSIGSDQAYSKAPLEGFPYMDINTPPLATPIRSSPSTPATGLSGTNKSSSHDGQSYAPWGSEQVPAQIDISSSNTVAAARSPHQIPTRSLWIGNLDSNTTGQELMRVFATYGAIESLRLLPEKECGFVNFVEMNDAIKARDDVLGRLGAKLENLGIGPAGTVRIGFGKIDSTPTGTNFRATSSANAMLQETTSGGLVANDNGIESAPISSAGSDGGVATRALWVGGIPATITSTSLLNIFQPYGPVESARILTHKNCAFINFERLEDAIRARKMLNGRDVLGSDVGAMKIGFAKVPSRNGDGQVLNVGDEAYTESLPTQKSAKNAPQLMDSSKVGEIGMENYRSNLMMNLMSQRDQEGISSAPPNLNASTTATATTTTQSLSNKQATTSSSSSIVPASDKGGVPLPAHMVPRPTMNDLQLLMSQLSSGQANQEMDVASVAEHRPSATYYMTIPLISEVSSGRRFETSRLREARRSIESGQLDMRQCDQLAKEYLDSIVDLASDYIGNTLVQKFFEHGSEKMKMEMLHQLAPHLAMTGCHKNGTWAAQKILDCCRSREQITLIAQHLRPYIPGLLLDQFGNYVVQCCLPWKQPINDFVFDAMVDRCWEIAQGRFGARSMRACLEKESVTDQQRKRVAMSIILNSVPLATSPNGSILLTWLLDTPVLAKSYKLLAPRFSPHLSHLCTHKLASTTVLRIIGQIQEPEASQILLEALFESVKDEILEDIVIDQVHGSQFITKVLACTNISREQREKYSLQVRLLVEKHQLVGVPAYRRLCEDLGLLPPNLTMTTSISAVSNNDRRSSPTNFNQDVNYSSPPGASFITPEMMGLLPMTPVSSMASRPSLAPPDAFNPYWDASSPVYKHHQNSSSRK